MQVVDLDLKLVQVLLVPPEVVATNRLNLLRVCLEAFLERLRLLLEMIYRLVHKVVYFIELTREAIHEVLLLIAHFCCR